MLGTGIILDNDQTCPVDTDPRHQQPRWMPKIKNQLFSSTPLSFSFLTWGWRRFFDQHRARPQKHVLFFSRIPKVLKLTSHLRWNHRQRLTDFHTKPTVFAALAAIGNRSSPMRLVAKVLPEDSCA
jgi:hypothetical protein